MSLPYLTADVPGIGGVIKQRPEDFFVQEIPLYETSGEGEHVFAEIQKVGMSTFDAVNRIASALNISSRDIGFAGMKDARAIARQVVSIWGTTEEAVMALKLPGIEVLWARRHGNKLRLGHLAANRFAIRIRQVKPADVVKIRPMLETIQKRGMPNYFGEQRFGRRGDNDVLGAALVRGDNVALLKQFLGHPRPGVDDPQSHAARKAYDANDLALSMKYWPRHCGVERRVLARFMNSRRPGASVRIIDQKLRRLWESALQSRIFNEVVARRLQSMDRLLAGDLAWKHDTGAVFAVEDLAVEQPRCETFEISPSGPLLGYRMTLPQGEALAIEEAVFDQFQLKPQEFRLHGRDKVKGARRPLRVRPTDVELSGGVDEHGEHITVAFTLPPGSFATTLMAELMKPASGALESTASAEDSGDDEGADAEDQQEQAESEHE